MANNILYIEDNPDNMTLVQRALEARGYRMLKAMKGLDGVAIAESEQVDLILLDINLPDIDGYEVARRLRSSAPRCLLPFGARSGSKPFAESGTPGTSCSTSDGPAA